MLEVIITFTTIINFDTSIMATNVTKCFIETNHLLRNAKNMTGFCMRKALIFHDLFTLAFF